MKASQHLFYRFGGRLDIFRRVNLCDDLVQFDFFTYPGTCCPLREDIAIVSPCHFKRNISVDLLIREFHAASLAAFTLDNTDDLEIVTAEADRLAYRILRCQKFACPEFGKHCYCGILSLVGFGQTAPGNHISLYKFKPLRSRTDNPKLHSTPAEAPFFTNYLNRSRLPDTVKSLRQLQVVIVRQTVNGHVRVARTRRFVFGGLDGGDDDIIASEFAYLFEGFLARAFTDRKHRYDRPYSENYTEHCQERPQLVQQQVFDTEGYIADYFYFSH